LQARRADMRHLENVLFWTLVAALLLLLLAPLGPP
jgi:hypothetical protein